MSVGAGKACQGIVCLTMDGLYGPFNAVKPITEKYWFSPIKRRDDYITDIEFGVWLLFCKFYGAEWKQENDEFNDKKPGFFGFLTDS